MAASAEQSAVDLVCEGGGVKGIAHIGAVSVLVEHGYRFQRVAGTSAGSIAAAFVAAGMEPARKRNETPEARDKPNAFSKFWRWCGPAAI